MRYLLCLIALAAMFIAGCEAPTTVAMVVQTDEMTLQVQNIVPTIPLQRPDGKMTTLAKAGTPFYLVAFVDAPAGQTEYIDPDVRKIAKGLWLESIRVAQITEPATGQTFPDDALSKCIPPKENLILVLDPKKLAWEMFRNPAAGTLLLIDKHGYIVEAGSLSDPKDVLFKTYQMAEEWDQKMWNRSFSIDSSD